jgi:Putative zinc-finger
MSMNERNNRSGNNHAEMAELIPWYVKGTLSADERKTIDSHLKSCEHCRQTLSECRTLAQKPASVQTEWQPSPAHFSRLMDALDVLEANEKAAPIALSNEIPSKTPKKPGIFQRLSGYFSQTPSLVRWTLAAETFAIAGIIGFMVLPHQLDPLKSTSFETLSNAESTDRKVANVVRVVFDADMSVKALSDLLKETKAQVRQGPSAVGAFTVEVAKDNVAQAMATFRANKNVRLVLLMDQTSDP